MSEADEWKKWEGWVPGDPVPGEVPGTGAASRRRPWRRRRDAEASAAAPSTPVPSVALPPPPPVGSTPPPPRAAVSGSPRGVGVARGCMVTIVGFMVLGFVVPLVGLVAGSVGDVGSGSDDGFEVVEESTAVSEGAPATAPDLLHEDPAAGLEWLRSTSGEDVAVASSLTFYPGYLIAEVEPPDAPGTLVRWVLYPDRSIGPDPVAVMDTERLAVADVAPDVLQAVVVDALAALAPDGGRATHLIVRPGPAATGPEYSVYVERVDGTSAGYSVYGVLGNLLRTQPAG